MEKTAMYNLMSQQMAALIEGAPLPLPSLSNCSALLWEHLKDINWAGFYLLKGDTLYLGPFQGKVACTVIPMGRGVCGACAKSLQVQLVPNVHEFPGHIACDGASNSEIVLPLMVEGQLVGVMDIDSPVFSRFDEEDAQGLQQICRMLAENINWKDGLL